MRVRRPSVNSHLERPGKILVLFALLLPVLLGMVGLVIDSGLAMAAHRRVRNAADAAALAAALDLFRGETTGTAKATAAAMVTTNNGLGSASVTVNIGKEITTGPYAGKPTFVEVLVSLDVSTTFMQVLGVTKSTVGGRAVAGFEPVAPEGAITLDPNAIPGISIQGNATLKVKGAVLVNSVGRGVDQYGDPVNL